MVTHSNILNIEDKNVKKMRHNGEELKIKN